MARADLPIITYCCNGEPVGVQKFPERRLLNGCFFRETVVVKT
jgi:hypothetical protein